MREPVSARERGTVREKRTLVENHFVMNLMNIGEPREPFASHFWKEDIEQVCKTDTTQAVPRVIAYKE